MLINFSFTRFFVGLYLNIINLILLEIILIGVILFRILSIVLYIFIITNIRNINIIIYNNYSYCGSLWPGPADRRAQYHYYYSRFAPDRSAFAAGREHGRAALPVTTVAGCRRDPADDGRAVGGGRAAAMEGLPLSR